MGPIGDSGKRIKELDNGRKDRRNQSTRTIALKTIAIPR